MMENSLSQLHNKPIDMHRHKASIKKKIEDVSIVSCRFSRIINAQIAETNIESALFCLETGVSHNSTHLASFYLYLFVHTLGKLHPVSHRMAFIGDNQALCIETQEQAFFQGAHFNLLLNHEELFLCLNLTRNVLLFVLFFKVF